MAFVGNMVLCGGARRLTWFEHVERSNGNEIFGISWSYWPSDPWMTEGDFEKHVKKIIAALNLAHFTSSNRRTDLHLSRMHLIHAHSHTLNTSCLLVPSFTCIFLPSNLLPFTVWLSSCLTFIQPTFTYLEHLIN